MLSMTSWPAKDHWAVRTRRRCVIVAFVGLIICVAGTAVSWTDFSGPRDVITGLIAPIGATFFGYALSSTLRGS
jgi:hypothetical protein